MLLLSVAVANISYGNFVQLVSWSLTSLFSTNTAISETRLRPVTGSLSPDAAKTLVQTFISSRLDYCNALLFGMSEGLMRRLQSVQNAAARLLTGARRRDHITPILRQLH